MKDKEEMINAVKNNLQSIPVSHEAIEDAISDKNLAASYEMIQKNPNMTTVEYYMRRHTRLEKEGKLPEPTRLVGLLPLRDKKYQKRLENNED